MNDAVAEFETALRRRNIVPPRALIGDGRLDRGDAAGRNGKRDAAYHLHLDGLPAGGFENHRDGQGWETWRAGIKLGISEAERAEFKRRMDAARAQRDADIRRRQLGAAGKAARIWQGAQACGDHDHPYLRRKHVHAHGLRLWRDKLLVPVCDLDGALRSLQFVDGWRKTPRCANNRL